MRRTRNTVLVIGYGQLPQGTPVYEYYKQISVVLEIDFTTDVIVDCSFNYLTPLTNRFLTELVKGYSLVGGLEPLLDDFREYVQIHSQRAAIRGLQAAYDKYCAYKLERTHPK